MKLLARPFLFFFIVCLVTVSSCTPQKRLQRLLTAHPELRAYEKQDSFEILRTVYIDTTLVPTTDNYLVLTEIDTLLRDTCIQKANGKEQRAKVSSRVKQLYNQKKCLEQPLLFTDTILYADKELELMLPVTVVVTQEGNAFSISVQGTGGRVLSNSKAVQVTAILQEDIIRYRKQGAWYVGGSLIALLLLLGTAYAVWKIYSVRIKNLVA
jgi:hypothetical protein